MKIKRIIILLMIAIPMIFTFCGSPKSETVSVIDKNEQVFAIGVPEIKYYSQGASLNYFYPGAIVIFKKDYTIYKQKGFAGKAYQIGKDTILHEIATIDTSLSDSVLVNQFLVLKIEVDSE
jgi:hypothetical protein